MATVAFKRALSDLIDAERSVRRDPHRASLGWQHLLTSIVKGERADVAPCYDGPLRLMPTYKVSGLAAVGMVALCLVIGGQLKADNAVAKPFGSGAAAWSRCEMGRFNYSSEALFSRHPSRELLEAFPTPPHSHRTSAASAQRPSKSAVLVPERGERDHAPAGEARHADSLSTFEAELLLISEAKAAIDRVAISRAISLLEEHARRFPSGVFQVERDGLRIIARCHSGSRPQDTREAQKFLREHAHSPLVDRVRRQCGMGK